MQIRPCYFQASVLLLTVGLSLPSFPASAQEGAADTTVPTQVVESRIAEIQASTDLDEAIRARLLDDYRKTIGFVEIARSYTDKANAYAQTRESAPEETRKIRGQLEKAAADTAELKLDLAEDASAQQIEARLQSEQANQAAVSAKFSSLGQQLAAESNRPRVIRERLLEASKLVDKLAADLKASVASDQPQSMGEARGWALSAQTAATNAEIRIDRKSVV